MERVNPLPWQGELWKQLVEWRARLPHALLLHGARGVGKRHVLKAFAQLLLCESPRDATPCGECAGCQLLAADNHPDLRWLVPAAQMPERDDADEGDAAAAPKAGRAAGAAKPGREIVIDQVRKISEFLSISSHRGGRRVVLLMPAEALNAPAANALLKVLEEPPPDTVFLAASDQLDAVLPTIRSRCVLLRAPMPSRLDALAWLRAAGVEQAESKLAEAGGAPMDLVAENSLQSQILEPAHARDVADVTSPWSEAHRSGNRRRGAKGRHCGAGNPFVTAVGMGLISGRPDRSRSLLSCVPAAIGRAGAGGRAATGGRLDGRAGAGAISQ